MERELEGGPRGAEGAQRAPAGGVPGQRGAGKPARRCGNVRPGRRPARQPDDEEAFSRLTSLLAEFRPILNSHFRQIHDLRDPAKVLYAPQIQRAITDVVAHLIRKKRLECARFRGYVVVAVDGVEQEVARRTKGAKDAETRYMLEFKVIAPNGLALSTFTERVKPHTTESGKRDCAPVAIASRRYLSNRV